MEQTFLFIEYSVLTRHILYFLFEDQLCIILYFCIPCVRILFTPPAGTVFFVLGKLCLGGTAGCNKPV